MVIKTVSIIGANGHLGPSILQALRDAKIFEITVISRVSSKSTYPADVRVTHIPDSEPSVGDLTRVLQGQDALVLAFSGQMQDMSVKLADAAAAAGVKRLIPADFGSCDSSSPRALDLIPLYVKKKTVREYLQSLEGGTLSWTGLINGHFFDYGLKSGLLGFNIKEHRASIFDSGDEKWSATTLGTIGVAVVKILQNEELTRNRLLYIHDFCVSQNQVLSILENLTSGEPWKVEHLDSDRFIKEMRIRTEKNPEDADAWEDLVSVVGIIDANWSDKPDLSNQTLSLPKLSLEDTIKNAVETS